MRGDRGRASQSVLMVVAGIVGLLVAGCASTGGRQQHSGLAACARLDTLYQDAGFKSSLKMSGKATFDIEQYRVRGQFTLATTPGGEFVFELSSNLLFGSQREDLVVSIGDGMLRVLDRERGRYYEGAEVDRLLRHELELDIDSAELISLVLGGEIPCRSLEETGLSCLASGDGQFVFSGRLEQRPVKIMFGAASGRLTRFEWPILRTGNRADQLQVEYSWGPGTESGPELTDVVVKVDSRGWRIKLRSDR
jgi:hypothetical protein